MLTLILAGIVFAVVFSHVKARQERGEKVSPGSTALAIAFVSIIAFWLASIYFSFSSSYYSSSTSLLPYLLALAPMGLYFIMNGSKTHGPIVPTASHTAPSQPTNLHEVQKLLLAQDARIRALEQKLNVQVSEPMVMAETPKVEKVAEPVKPVQSTEAPVKHEETQLTGKWFAIIGIAAVVIGVALFLRYAFANNLIPPVGRVGLGILGGALLLGLGHYLRMKYKEFAGFLSGGGLILLYLSVFGAFNYYHLITQFPALIFMSVVSALGVALALRYDSQHFAIIAHIGAFLTPFLIGNDTNQQTMIFTYALVLNLAFWLLSVRKGWHYLYFINVVGTWLLVFGWMAGHYTESQRVATVLWLAAFYVIQILGPYGASFARKIALTTESIAITVINSGVFFVTAYALEHGGENRQTFIFLLGAVVLAGLGLALKSANEKDVMGRVTYYSLALALATTVIPIQLTDRPTVILWTAEALLLGVLGVHFKNHVMRVYSLIAYAGAGVVLLITMVNRIGTGEYLQPFVNAQALTQILFVAALFFSAYLLRKHKDDVRPEERGIPNTLRCFGHALLLYTLSAELIRHFESLGSSYNDMANFSLSLLWAGYAAGVIVVGIVRRLRIERMLATALFGIVIVKVFLYDSANLPEILRIVSFISLGVILLVVSFLFYRFKERIKHFLIEE